MAPAGPERHRWWKEAAIYQIYPASFKDGNDDGWGDIKGITSKLDHIKALGTDVIWISPMYPSPQVDMGYDISDYKNIDPRYGTMDDMDHLASEMKKRGIKLMMDLVVNHTSDQHAWFKESRSSKDSPKRSWYIWKPPKGHEDDGTPIPPNNWAQILGEGKSAWTYDEGSKEFYLSLFTPEQPDLNWETVAVRDAVHDVMTFWLDRGASGFRMDVINHISKTQTFPDAPVTLPQYKYQPAEKYFANGPRQHEFLREIYDKVLAKYDAITVGEMPYVHDENEIVKVVGQDNKELQMIFIFDVVCIDMEKGKIYLSWHDWDVSELADIVSHWQQVMIERNGWNTVFLENHDQPRSVSRYTDDSDQWRVKGAKLLALMQTTLSGTLYVYQGEEIGMRNMPPTWDLAEYKDVMTINLWEKAKQLGAGEMELAKKVIHRRARDHARTPVQWSAEPNAGFSSAGVETWMRVNDDYETVNAAAQAANPDGKGEDGGMTVFHFWQRAIAARRDHKDVFVYGDFALVADGRDGVFAYRRTSQAGSSWLTLLNFTGKPQTVKLPPDTKVKSWVAGNYGPAHIDKPASGSVELEPWEGVLGVCE